jgi:lipid II:glycine glycyltransferase (peptidoglycan interpeptide bridge formation enzyme)
MITLIKNENEIDSILPFFAQEKYLETKSSIYGWFVSEKFILPFVLFSTYIFKRIVFTTEPINKHNSSIEEEIAFLDHMQNYIKKNNICDFIHKPQPSAIFRTYPRNANVFKWGTFQLPINNDFDDMLTRVSSSQRKYVRHAIRDNITITKTDDFEEVYHLCNGTLSRQKIQLLIDKNEFAHQYKNLHPQNMIMFKATFENEVQGVLVIFFDDKTAFAEYAGSVPRPKNGCLKLLHLYAMQYLAQNHNLTNFDFVGAVPDIKEDSKEAGIQKFKREFGAKIKEGYQFTVIFKPIKYYLFTLFLKMRLMLKGVTYVDPVERDKRLSKSRLEV